MTLPSSSDLIRVVEATWPPASKRRIGPWTIRDGQGGGKRVSAATAEGPFAGDDFSPAEDAMAELGQPNLFMIRKGEDALDSALVRRGYDIIDPVDLFVARMDELKLPKPPRLSAMHIWPPLAIQRELWAAGGIGPARIAVMERAAEPKTALLGRHDDRAMGVAFVAIHDGIAMVHALEVLAPGRRQGVASRLMAGAHHWAAGHGAEYLSLVVTKANAAAQALYASLGFCLVGQYHYRIRP